jgi:hypothetical protein
MHYIGLMIARTQSDVRETFAWADKARAGCGLADFTLAMPRLAGLFLASVRAARRSCAAASACALLLPRFAPGIATHQ